MKTVKVMSIIVIILISLSLVCMICFYDSDLNAVTNWVLIGLLYLLSFCFVGLFQSNLAALIKLIELKWKGILSKKQFHHEIK
jgi:hypothetical protein